MLLKEKFGSEARPRNDLSVPEYDAVYLYKAAVEMAGSTDTKAVLDALDGVSYAGPGGSISLSKQRHAPLTKAFIRP
jgi:urea transport system substrate-binding protein